MKEISFQYRCLHCGKPITIDNNRMVCDCEAFYRGRSYVWIENTDINPCPRCFYPPYFIFDHFKGNSGRFSKERKICSNPQCPLYKVNIYKDFFMIFYRDQPLFSSENKHILMGIEALNQSRDPHTFEFIQTLLNTHSQQPVNLKDFL